MDRLAGSGTAYLEVAAVLAVVIVAGDLRHVSVPVVGPAVQRQPRVEGGAAQRDGHRAVDPRLECIRDILSQRSRIQVLRVSFSSPRCALTQI